jgi:hypothetical protein
MKELLLLLKGMKRPEIIGSPCTYGEISKLFSLLLNEIAPDKVQEAQKKLKTE